MRLVTDSQPRNTVGQDRPPIRVNGGGRQLTVDLARRAHQSPGRLTDEDGLRGLPLAQWTGQGQSGVVTLITCVGACSPPGTASPGSGALSGPALCVQYNYDAIFSTNLTLTLTLTLNLNVIRNAGPDTAPDPPYYT